MNTRSTAHHGWGLVASALMIALAGCGGGTGSTGPAGPAGAPGTTVGVASLAQATALTIAITGVTVGGPPVVNFNVTNQYGVPVPGFAATDLRFNMAKLTPGTNGNPSTWQDYIVRASGGAMQGSQERQATGYAWGSLVDHKDGTYTYTFATDITSAAANPCPSPCTDAAGNALDISYQPTFTNRVGIQQSNRTYPLANATFDFVPAGGAVITQREIVETANCNVCHDRLVAHGSRVDAKLCVTCHNPGSWVAGSPNTPVDFKVYIHKIHSGKTLPSVLAGTPYKIGNADFSDVVFPQDLRNCTKCHTGADAATPQGDNWETEPSIAACGSCHDNVYFGAAPDPLKPYQTVAHKGGDVSGVDGSTCVLCHKSGGPGGSIADKHAYPALMLAEAAKFKLNIVSVTNSAPGLMPSIRFSLTDPTNGNAAYDIANTPAITGGSMALLIGWSTSDFNNSGTSVSPSPVSISLLSKGALASTVTDDGDGTYTVTSPTAIPLGATGSGRVGFYARMSYDVDGDGVADTIQVTSAVKDFLITGSSVVARRTVVNIANCDKCHQQLSLHGGARTDEPQLCVMCHNPDNTDTARRLAGAPVGTLDNKREEAIDFKRLIHGIHAGAKTLYDGTAGHGFRQKGLVIWGYPGAANCLKNGVYTCQNDFSDVRFPGILNNCATCHTATSYQLTGLWASPAQSGILGSTIDHGASLADPTDDMKISPTAAVCSSCHDDALSQQHMTQTGGALFSATPATIGTNLETCSLCHGPGGIVDVKVVHLVH